MSQPDFCKVLCLYAVLVSQGCQRAPDAADSKVHTVVAPPIATFKRRVASLSPGDIEIISHVLQEHPEKSLDRICFLTVTPMNEWGETGKWEALPQNILDKLAPFAAKYRPASEAYLKDGHVLVKGSDKKAWMRWITIKKWNSETRVVVEEGVWCCPLGGGASTNVYKKDDGQWQFVRSFNDWAS